MICETYLELTPVEKAKLIGEIVHCIQSDEFYLKIGTLMVIDAKEKGLFDNVTILPDSQNNHNS